jgi:hypothetical protein
MKVTFIENDKIKTVWENIGEGIVFSHGNPVEYFMKVEEISDQRDNVFNSVNLATGELVGFMPDCRVKIVDAHLMVKE